MKKIVLIDMDGPLADFESGFLAAWQKTFPNEFFLPVERRTTRYVNQEYPARLDEKIESVKNAEGFFTGLPPLEAGVRAAREMSRLGFTVFICTNAIYKSKTCLTEKKYWLEKYLGPDFAKNAIFTKDKTVIRGQYLIDDALEITGEVTPEWSHIIFDQPFNKAVTDWPRIKIDWSNWKEVIAS